MVQTIGSAFAIYFIVWWLVLFTVLPFGVRGQHESEGMAAGTDPGAPIMARMGRKLIWTTLISSTLFACLLYAYYTGLLNVDRLSKAVGIPF